MERRTFLTTTSATALAAALPALAQSAPTKKRRVAALGHTGRGNFGHGMDTVWLKVPNAEIVAVSDGNQDTLEKQMDKLKVDQGFTDYRDLLQKTKPEFVTVCPRHPDQHAAMALAAIEAGVKGVYVEKPFCRSPNEADQLVAACEKHGAKIAIAHRNRYHPVLQVIDQMIAEGKLGRLLEIRGRGKGDRRGGGEDLWVLGTHVMNLINYFGGAPKTCSAVILQDGKPVTKAGVYNGAEALGPLAGNEIHARYEMSGGVIAVFDSIANDDTKNAGFGLQLIGSQGTVNIQCDLNPVAHFWPGNPFQPNLQPQPWIPITTAGVGKPETQPELITSIYNHVAPIEDLIAACDTPGREPLCDVYQGRTTIEMVTSVFESHIHGKTVSFPLEQRENPLGAW